MSQVLTMTLAESTNTCYITDTVACTVKLNIKDTFLGDNGFPVNVYIVNKVVYHLGNFLFSE